ncbi:HAD family hydrolase, partial [Mycolicibacter heraklionensis]|uniref:HAD family hydrolase n=1 Tax=Mycolicibacter heraklionensis TaxID=512402 RepID=UPI000A6733EF
GEPRSGLVDLVLSLFSSGLWIAVVGAGPRAWVQERVRELIGDGMAETVVSADDLTGPAGDAELYRLALWELGIVAGEALVIAGYESGARTAAAIGLPVIYAGSSRYDGLLANGCRELQAQRVVAHHRDPQTTGEQAQHQVHQARAGLAVGVGERVKIEDHRL